MKAQTSRFQGAPRYFGPDRRRRTVYVTRHTEYHFDGDSCVAVRDLASGQWQVAHAALRRRLDAVARLDPGGSGPAGAGGWVLGSGEPRVGDVLLFSGDGAEMATSALSAIARPEKATVGAYPP